MVRDRQFAPLAVDADHIRKAIAVDVAHGQASMIRIVTSAAEAKEALAGDTACAIINVSLPDGSAVALANTLRQLRPSIRIIFVTSRAGRALPASLRELEPLVEKTTGLHLLKIALAKALAEKSPNIDPGC